MHEAGAELLGNDRLEVGLGDLDLLVASSLNRTNAPLSESPCTWKPSFSSVSAKA